MSGVKHVKLATKRGETASQSVQQLVPFLEASGKRSEFAMDLCNAFLAADTPLRKLDTLELKEFLERWTKKEVPSPVTLRLNYLKAVYDRKIDSIRQFINGKFLWVSIDESTDACGRALAHTVVGALDGSDTTNFLLNVESLEKPIVRASPRSS